MHLNLDSSIICNCQDMKATSAWRTGLPLWLSSKDPHETQETQEVLVRSLGREDHLEEEMAAHCSILA